MILKSVYPSTNPNAIAAEINEINEIKRSY